MPSTALARVHRQFVIAWGCSLLLRLHVSAVAAEALFIRLVVDSTLRVRGLLEPCAAGSKPYTLTDH